MAIEDLRKQRGRWLLVLSSVTLGTLAIAVPSCVLPAYDVGKDQGGATVGGGGATSDASPDDGANTEPTSCVPLADCGFGCTDLMSDPKNCGECGNSCQVGPCENGSCVGNPPNPCPGSQSSCSGQCTD